MQVTKKMTVQRDEVVDVVCNKCGESQKVDVAEMRDEDGFKISAHVYFHEYLPVDYRLGFYSRLFGDETRLVFDLCEKCLHEFVAGFKIKAELT